MKRVLLALLLVVAVVGFVYLLTMAGQQAATPEKASLPQDEGSRARVGEPSDTPPPSRPAQPGIEATIPPPPSMAAQPDSDAIVPPVQQVEAPPAAPPSEVLKERGIALPIAGLQRSDIVDTYDQARGGGERRHEAADIMAPRGTPVLAVRSGTIVKLFNSEAGGLTIYQFDANEKHCFYYAHLDRYAEGLREGMLVKQGTVIGYVGSTGNANPDAPHLHFGVYELGPEKHWYTGNTPINPYPLLLDALERKREN